MAAVTLNGDGCGEFVPRRAVRFFCGRNVALGEVRILAVLLEWGLFLFAESLSLYREAIPRGLLASYCVGSIERLLVNAEKPSWEAAQSIH